MTKKKEKREYLIALKISFFAILFLFASYSVDVAHSKQPFFDIFQQETILVTIKNQNFNLDTENVFIQDIENYNPKQEKFSLYGFKNWLLGKQTTYDILNQNYLQKEIKTWEHELGLTASQEGSVSLQNGELVVVNPKIGSRVDTAHIEKSLIQIAKQKEEQRKYNIFGRIVIEKPKTKQKELDMFVKDISVFLSRDFNLQAKNFSITHTLPQEELSRLIKISFDTTTRKHIVDIQTLYLEEQLGVYNREVQDAGFLINQDNTVSITPSQVGLVLDGDITKQNIQEAIYSQNQSADIALTTVEPELNTEQAEALEIKHPVVSFTTYFSCCESRAKNIQAVAKILDGTIVYPGEEWNLNTFIGKRTPERGFLPAGTLIKGSLIETTGGGISQFATTFYNAVYWGGYKDISHTPHSRYFSRYPEGIEATISWPKPDLIFQNNTPYGILVDTKTGDTFVTVQFFGNNDGRFIQGKHKDGKTTITVTQAGGDNAKIVESLVDNKTELYPPKEIYYVDPLREPNAIFTKTEGRPSYSVDIVRTITNKTGEVLETRKWKTYYLSEDKEYLVQSCEFAPENSVCKTKEDVENEKKALEEFFAELEKNT